MAKPYSLDLRERVSGLGVREASAFAHELAAEVVRHPGALAPPAAIDPMRAALRGLVSRRI